MPIQPRRAFLERTVESNVILGADWARFVMDPPPRRLAPDGPLAYSQRTVRASQAEAHIGLPSMSRALYPIERGLIERERSASRPCPARLGNLRVILLSGVWVLAFVTFDRSANSHRKLSPTQPTLPGVT